MFGIKDSEFKEADEVRSDDKVAIVQDGDNRIIGLEELAEYLVADIRKEFEEFEKRLKAVEDAIKGGTVVPPVEPDDPDEMVTLTISPYPEDAVVLMNGTTTNSVTVKKDTTVSVAVSRDGYETYTRSYKVTKTETIEIRLDKIEEVEKPTEVSRDLILSFDGEYETIPASGGNWEMVASLVINYSDGTKTTDDVTDSVEVTIDNDGLKYNGGAFYWLENATYERRVANVNVKYGYLNRQFASVQLAAVVERCTVTINPTPSDAAVKINGIARNNFTVDKGETVSYEVSRDGYVTKTGSIVATEDKTIDVVLVEEQPIEPTTVTFTVTATPSNATVIMNGVERRTITVEKGTSVEWSVSLDGYIPQSGTALCNEDYNLDVVLSEIVMTSAQLRAKSITGKYANVTEDGGSFTMSVELVKKFSYGDDVVTDIDIMDCEVTTTNGLLHDGTGVFTWKKNTSDMRESVITVSYKSGDIDESFTITSSQNGVTGFVSINNGEDLSFTSANSHKEVEISANVDWEITIKQ